MLWSVEHVVDAPVQIANIPLHLPQTPRTRRRFQEVANSTVNIGIKINLQCRAPTMGLTVRADIPKTTIFNRLHLHALHFLKSVSVQVLKVSSKRRTAESIARIKKPRSASATGV
jgi:hypothetical protein